MLITLGTLEGAGGWRRPVNREIFGVLSFAPLPASASRQDWLCRGRAHSSSLQSTRGDGDVVRTALRACNRSPHLVHTLERSQRRVPARQTTGPCTGWTGHYSGVWVCTGNSIAEGFAVTGRQNGPHISEACYSHFCQFDKGAEQPPARCGDSGKARVAGRKLPPTSS
jgi:hypothetical protein